uniref:PITH domain-containing protein n=1 Tax=Rhizochromulina marina TaxID=1034831 RepID=A0A7S2WJK3_9STRA|mmetsp:Transcript_26561/g.77342  ORF Transcript_26561/g.77342 Transcript_26561/m.77342 type:complete len:185 (+) Transcript_26561:222-776(+)
MLLPLVPISLASGCGVPCCRPCQGIFKPFARRAEPEPTLLSDSDEELIIKITFVSPVHIRRIMVIGGGEEEGHPSHLKAFANREDVDFSSAEDISPTQEWPLEVNRTQEGFVVTRQAPFTSVTAVTLYISANHGSVDQTAVQYIGMQGDHTHDRRAAVDAMYELQCTHQETDVKAPHGALFGPN